MVRVVLDGRISGADGIGRVTEGLGAVLTSLDREHQATVITVTAPDAPRYSQDEGEELVAMVGEHRADLLHLLDYRSPLGVTPVPVVATVHDLLRLNRPQHCYNDNQFVALFGVDRMRLLQTATRRLRKLIDLPPGVRRAPRSWHEQFYALMLAHTAATANLIITPTRAVAADLVAAVGHPVTTVVAPWGTDHLPEATASPLLGGVDAGRYLLYVGQARSHKGLSRLLNAYRTSSVARCGVALALVGRDFDSAFTVSWDLPAGVRVLGKVADADLSNLYLHAAGLVHFAEHEGFGFPPLEAMRLGTRVLVSDLPVLRETLGPSARFTNPTDPVAAARAIKAVLDDPDTEHEQVKRRDWAAQYRWRDCAATILTSYRQILA